ncbi:MAG: hypothetical protein KAI59_02895 [Planctomycetes bacterium]|nr:hypothetical protein [Planctomycetota bacterium]MCK5472953.1 hypothetical protein [Planctomycetota bacterium]
MTFESQKEAGWFGKLRKSSLFPAFLMLIGLFAQIAEAQPAPSVEHYKMLSFLEYQGNGQFDSQVEALVEVKKQDLLDGKFSKYFISTNDFDIGLGNKPQSKDITFVLSNQNRNLSGLSGDLAIVERANNKCIGSLQKISKCNIGKTWKQSFDVSQVYGPLPQQLNFTVTAIHLATEAFGEMLAVRAISEPFLVRVASASGQIGYVTSKISVVYLFNMDMDDIYMSASVFEASTAMNGFNEEMRYEFATYKSDSYGVAADLTGLGSKFTNFVKKIGLRKKPFEVVEPGSLPQWVLIDGLRTAAVGNVCAALSCEGAVNPVSSIFVAGGRTLSLQGLGGLSTFVGSGTVGGGLSGSVPGVGGLAGGGGLAIGGGVGTGLAVAGVTVGTVAVAGGFDSEESDSSPSTP